MNEPSGEVRPAPTLRDLRRCFDGRIPAVIATSAADGTPNITYLSAVHPVDDQRVALSNQFMSKTSRNLAENPRASLLLIDPVSFSEYRLTLRYERTDRRGPVFERLRDDVDKVAGLTGMRDVFRLRSADICRVDAIETVLDLDPPGEPESRTRAVALPAAAELVARLGRCADLETMVGVALRGLDELLGYRHSSVMLLDEEGRRLFTIASHGFPSEGVGSELEVGEGVAGAAAERCEPVRLGQLRQMQKYSRSVRSAYERQGTLRPEIPLPQLADMESRVAVPAMARGELVGVLVVDSPLPVAFDDDDAAILTLVANVIAQMVALDRVEAETGDRAPSAPVPAAAAPVPAAAPPDPRATLVRFFAEDGSVFLGGDYLIRGVAGRILWSLVRRHEASGQVEFTTKELRLDRSLELPGFRDNLDARLVLLMRRLEERGAPVQLTRVGRGRFRMDLDTSLVLEAQP